MPKAQHFSRPFLYDRKVCKRSSQLFFFRLFAVMEKEPKDQADGKCSRTVPFPPTVGIALARVVRAKRLAEFWVMVYGFLQADSSYGGACVPQIRKCGDIERPSVMLALEESAPIAGR